jgi:hypothetical protein
MKPIIRTLVLLFTVSAVLAMLAGPAAACA